MATAIQSSFGTSLSSMIRKKEPLPRHHWTVFFKRIDRTESDKEPEPVPLLSGMNKIAACPPSPIAEDPSVLYLPLTLLLTVTLFPALPECSFDASPSMPAVVLHYSTFQGTVL